MTEDSLRRIESFYDQSAEAEWQRLELHRTEFAVTCRALAEYLPPWPAAILDIGGGPGRYAIHLARQGYTVTLVDLAAANLRLAHQKAAEAGVELAGSVHANALDLSLFADASFDVVLLMGPLYHLLDLAERMHAVREAVRVLKPGGIVFGSCISRFAPIRDSEVKNIQWVLDDPAYALRMLATGLHDNGDGFTNAYFMHPLELAPLFTGQGVEELATIGVEGIVAGHEELINPLQGEQWDLWVEINYRIAHDPAALGASDHLLFIGRKN